MLKADMIINLLDEKGWSQEDFEHKTGLSPKTVQGLLDGTAKIIPDIACILEDVLGEAYLFWMN